MSDHSISCTIINQTTGTIGWSSSSPNDHTDLVVNANSIGSGVTSTDAFVGSNSATSGCGGSVTFTMPNNIDKLVVVYNTTAMNDNSYCYPMLQSIDTTTNIASDAYYCVTTDSFVAGKSDGVTTTITVYDKPE